MKKPSPQFLIDVISLAGASFLIYWTSKGGLGSEIKVLFDSKQLTTGKDQVQHFSDFMFYFAILFIIVSGVMYWLRQICNAVIYCTNQSQKQPTKGLWNQIRAYLKQIQPIDRAVQRIQKIVFSISEWLNKVFTEILASVPCVFALNGLLMCLIESLVIFAGMYIYLLQNNEYGLKTSKLILFPFWFLIGKASQVLGLFLSALFGFRFTTFSNIVLTILGITMITQILGYSPLQLI